MQAPTQTHLNSEIWTVRKDNEVALQQEVMTMVTWMCGIKLRQISK